MGFEASICVLLFMDLRLEMSRSRASKSEGLDLYSFVDDMLLELEQSQSQ